MIAVENVGTQVNRKLRLGRVRLAVADAPGSIQLVEFARTTVAPGSLIRTDGARMFRVLAQEGYTHQYISGYSSPEPEHVTLPGPHRVASLLKRWNAGTHHYRVEREHLQYYLDEFAFRFNRRTSAWRCVRSGRWSRSTAGTRRAVAPTRVSNNSPSHALRLTRYTNAPRDSPYADSPAWPRKYRRRRATRPRLRPHRRCDSHGPVEPGMLPM